MKAIKFFLPVLFIISMSSTSCSKDEVIAGDPITPTLSVEEENYLKLMREEEKLARDVYLYNYDLYGNNIFNNIANAEQAHMDRILDLLISYNIPDPAATTIGVFNSPELQKLYNDLTTLSSKSLLDALVVGATIEDLDIKDLDECIAGTNKEDLLVVYDNLNCGSRNHMRGFSSQIKSNGGTYTPQFITLQQYQDIINSGHEKCGMN